MALITRFVSFPTLGYWLCFSSVDCALILQPHGELIIALRSNFARLNGNKSEDWEGRSKMVGWRASLLSYLCIGQDI